MRARPNVSGETPRGQWAGTGRVLEGPSGGPNAGPGFCHSRWRTGLRAQRREQGCHGDAGPSWTTAGRALLRKVLGAGPPPAGLHGYASGVFSLSVSVSLIGQSLLPPSLGSQIRRRQTHPSLLPPLYTCHHDAEFFHPFVVRTPWPRARAEVSSFSSCYLRPLTGSGLFSVSGTPRSAQHSCSHFVFLRLAWAGTPGWGLTAHNPSFPQERVPERVPDHHLQSAI